MDRRLIEVIPRVALRSAERWKHTAELLADQFTRLRNPLFDNHERAALMDLLRESVADLPFRNDAGPW